MISHAHSMSFKGTGNRGDCQRQAEGFSLVPKLYLGTPLSARLCFPRSQISFGNVPCASRNFISSQPIRLHRLKIGHEMASASTLPNEIWERENWAKRF